MIKLSHNRQQKIIEKSYPLQYCQFTNNACPQNLNTNEQTTEEHCDSTRQYLNNSLKVI